MTKKLFARDKVKDSPKKEKKWSGVTFTWSKVLIVSV
jgi:hypothetical protein